jgi:hypothetical protein
VQLSIVVPVLLVMPAVGTPVSFVMVMPASELHPLAAVTVTVYVPAAVIERPATVDMTVDPSVHEYVCPPVAVTLMAVMLQVSSVVPLLLVMPAVGAVLSFVMVMPASELHPLDPVTVTV